MDVQEGQNYIVLFVGTKNDCPDYYKWWEE